MLLVDTNIVIEAVRTGVWNAVTGARQVASVPEVADELGRGEGAGMPGYVRVTPAMVARMRIEPLTPLEAAAFRLAYPQADGMDPGERDLMALAYARRAEVLQICLADKAAVVAAHRTGMLDNVVSLEWVANSVGGRPAPPLRVQFTEHRMSEWRTALLLGGRP